MDAQHIVNVSGGKDSAATYLLAIERGNPFRAVTADTGFEHEITYDWIRKLPERTGGPVVEVVRADFAERMVRRRARLPELWGKHGVPDDIIRAAQAVMEPTGNVFLDLCIIKGRFPSMGARFCTEELKVWPIEKQVLAPALERGPVIKWQGERRDESFARRNLPKRQTVRGWPHPMVIWRPIVEWTAADTFALHRKHGLDPNPLYSQGMSRVGCFPCIMANKRELAQIARRFPEAFERLERWEAIVAQASKRGAATFFASDVTPEGAAAAKRGEKGARDGYQYPSATEVARWAKTGRGGRNFDLINEIDGADAEAGLCSSMYGLCE